METRAVRGCLVVLALAGLGACAGLGERLPWRDAPPPAVQALRELEVLPPPDAPPGAPPLVVLQLLERNTLVLDLRDLPASGELRLRPLAGRWPVRLALRVEAGRFGTLELSGSQRLLLPVAEDRAAGVLTLPVDPAVHAGNPTELRMRWGSLLP
ncbi:MAG: hypothetical protein RL026_649 [Pseudomonadota bacterium]|jgi:hypothetical protein